MSNQTEAMDAMSSVSESKMTPYSENHAAGAYSPIHSPAFDKNGSVGPSGFTLLRGHIKLMAMVPHLPENHVSTKPWNQDSPYHHEEPSQSLPPITPRMMPSISQKYWRPQQYLPPHVFQEKVFTPTGYYSKFIHHPSMWPPQQHSPQHYQSYNVPTSFHQSMPVLTPLDDFPGPKQQFMEHQGLNEPASYAGPSSPYMNYSQWHQAQMEMAYQQSYEKAQLEYYHYLNSKGSPYHSYPPPQQHPMNYRPSSGAFPYSHQQQQQFPPYAVQSMPCFVDGAGTGTPPNFNNFGMPPLQQCSSLPVIKSPKTKKRIPLKTFHKDDDKDVCIVIEEEDISSSSSLSSTEEYEIRRKGPEAIVVKEECKNADLIKAAITKKDPECVAVKKESQHKVECDNSTKKIENQSGSNKPGKKGVVVHVHDCFLSDSSEAELDQDQSSDMDGVRRAGKRKPVILKCHRNSGGGGAIKEVFADLDQDLNPDEVRSYTCEYLVELLSSKDWNNCYNALQIVVRMARHRPQVLLNYLHENGGILWCTFGHITSPKSALCRAAVVTFKELFERLPGALDGHLEKITEKLVVKSMAPNKFIRVECERALMAMVEHGNLIKVLSALENVRKKPNARAAGLKMALARMALEIVKTAGVDLCLMNSSYADKLLPMLFCFMTEPNSGIRTVAKEALGMLMNHLQFEAAVMKHVSFDRNSTEVFKKLDKMRGRCNNYNNRCHHPRSISGRTRLLVAK